MVAQLPPNPFNPLTEVVERGQSFYRIHNNSRSVVDFHPGYGSGTRPSSRFAFFGTPHVPVLYAAQTEDAAISETFLHDMPLSGGTLQVPHYWNSVMGRVHIDRNLNLAKLQGHGLRALGVQAANVTDTDSADYPITVKWGEAVYSAGFDGIIWTSRKCNDSSAIVLFGDKCADAVSQDTTYARAFCNTPDLDWLIRTLIPITVQVQVSTT